MTFEPLVPTDGRSFEDLYRIYAEAISIAEQKPRDQVAAMVLRPDYKVLLAKRNGRVIGFSILFLPPQESFCLLEYMAVDSMQREGGVGAALFRHSLQAAASVSGERPTILEVDSDRSPSPHQALCRRRQQFYRRLGCRRVEGLSYLLPLATEVSPPEMDLMVHVSPAVDSLPKLRLKHWLEVMYQEVYGCSPGDLRIHRMMEPVPDPAKLV